MTGARVDGAWWVWWGDEAGGVWRADASAAVLAAAAGEPAPPLTQPQNIVSAVHSFAERSGRVADCLRSTGARERRR